MFTWLETEESFAYGWLIINRWTAAAAVLTLKEGNYYTVNSSEERGMRETANKQWMVKVMVKDEIYLQVVKLDSFDRKKMQSFPLFFFF